MATAEPPRDEEKLKRRYLKALKVFLLLAIIYTLWIAVLIIGIYFLKLGSKFAILTIDQWIYSAIALLSIIIVLDIIFLLRYVASRKKQITQEKPQHVFLHGKQVHSYTLPVGAKGGIFSKTYIMIDETRVLNLRYQMIQPNILWGKKQ